MEKSKKENKVWKIISIVINVVFYVFIAIILLFSISNMGRKDTLDIPSIFGNGLLTTPTNSMDGDRDNSFTKDDLIFVKVIKDRNREKLIEKIEVGSIITFSWKLEYEGEDFGIQPVTHRVVEIQVNDGIKYFFTQGDNIASDPSKKYVVGGANDSDNYELISSDKVLAVYSSKMSGAGKAMKYLQTPNGFLFVIVVPTAAFFIFVAITMIFNFMRVRQFKNEEERQKDHDEQLAKVKADLEAEKEKMRAELLAEMNKNKTEE